MTCNPALFLASIRRAREVLEDESPAAKAEATRLIANWLAEHERGWRPDKPQQMELAK